MRFEKLGFFPAESSGSLTSIVLHH